MIGRRGPTNHGWPDPLFTYKLFRYLSVRLLALAYHKLPHKFGPIMESQGSGAGTILRKCRLGSWIRLRRSAMTNHSCAGYVDMAQDLVPPQVPFIGHFLCVLPSNHPNQSEMKDTHMCWAKIYASTTCRILIPVRIEPLQNVPMKK